MPVIFLSGLENIYDAMLGYSVRNTSAILCDGHVTEAHEAKRNSLIINRI